jgi:hypothetical protein
VGVIARAGLAFDVVVRSECGRGRRLSDYMMCTQLNELGRSSSEGNRDDVAGGSLKS